MKLVKRQGPVETDVEVELVGNELTAGDLALALGLGDPGADVRIDGVRHPAGTPIETVRLGHGSVIAVADDDDDEDSSGASRPDAVAELHQIAGLAAGGTVALCPGRWAVGPVEPLRAELTEGSAPSRRFELTVDRQGRCTVSPAMGVLLRLDGVLVSAPSPVSDQVIEIEGAAFRVTPALNRTRRRLQTSTSGSASFARVPRTLVVSGSSVPVDLPARPTVTGTKRRARKRFDEALAATVPAVVTELDRARRVASRRQRHGAPDVAEVRARAELLTANLWERRPAHPDFGVLAVGFGQGSWAPVPTPTGFPEIEALLRAATSLADIPVTVGLEQVVALGIAGPRSAALAVTRWLLVQAAVLHGPADLGIHVLTSEERLARWDWTKWLPHLVGSAGEPRVATSPDEANALLGPLASFGSRRSDAAPAAVAPEVSGSGPGAGPGPDAGLGPARALLVIDALEHLDARASIPRALLAGRGRPTRAIILAEHASQLPPGCGAVLTVTEDGAATVSEPGRERVVTGILATGITAATARRTARHLAVLEDAAAGGAPDGVHLVDLIGFGPSGSMADDIERRWKAWAGTGRTTIPLGRTTDSEVLEVDLRADGPHAFVAGTAGAATTELLRGVLLGAATSFDPSRLAFVLVDTEGAGTFGRCAELPHVAAALVGPDAGLGSRALRRVLAELQRREDQAAPIRAGEAPRAVPARLLVVVDAFDTLVAENPDLVPTVVDLARRGGPLGIHLLLVTRHNDSILAGSIRAVTSLRLAPAAREPDQALRLLSSDAGPDVPVDDRWFVRLGSGDLAAFRRVSVSGTRAMEGARAPLDVRPLLLKPSHAPTTRITITAAGRTVGPAPLTDLDLVVGAIGELAARRGMAAVPLPGPDGLPEQVELAAVVGTDPARRWAVPLGIAESAGRLRPSPYRWDTTHGSLVVVGSSPSETALAVAAATVGLASRYPAANLEIHVLDTPTGRLSALAGLPHGGSVTAADDVVAVRTVVEHLEGLLERRTPGERHRLALVVVGDLGALVAACRGAGDTELAARLVRVVRAGWGVDVLAVVGATQVADVPTELWRNVEQRLVLSLDRTSDWRALGLAAPDGPLAPLRAIDAATGLRVQLASFPGDDVANGVAAAAAAGTGEP